MFVLPLLAFVSISFVLPIFDMLFRSVDNPVVSTYLPETIEKLASWEGPALPKEDVFETLARELLIAKKTEQSEKSRPVSILKQVVCAVPLIKRFGK